MLFAVFLRKFSILSLYLVVIEGIFTPPLDNWPVCRADFFKPPTVLETQNVMRVELAMQSLNALMQNLERSPQWRATAGLRQVLAIWPQLVGEAVAQHSRPIKVYRGVLQVAVSSAAWAQTLTFERSRILHKLHQKLPATKTEIQEIRFAPAQWQRETQQSQPTLNTLLTEHPSWADLPKRQPNLSPKTAHDAFQQWADRKRTQLASQSQCPRCHSPCPTQELKRWSVCAICITHQWQAD